MPNRRTPYLLREGDPITLPRTALHQALYFALAQDVLGLDAERLIQSVAVSIPLPRYEEGRPLRGTPGVDPRALRYPFMWLPESLSERYEIPGPDGEHPQIEDDDTWMLRVVLEMCATGAYNISEAGWIDVLALHGLDVDNADDLDRVSAWWNGADDPILDAIDLSDIFSDEGDPDWAMRAATALAPTFIRASMALSAVDIREVAKQISDGNMDAFGGGDALHAVPNLVNVARSRFVDEPSILSYLDSLRSISLRQYPTNTAMIQAVVPGLVELLEGVFATYLPDLQGVIESDIAQADDDRFGYPSREQLEAEDDEPDVDDIVSGSRRIERSGSSDIDDSSDENLDAIAAAVEGGSRR